MMMMRNQGYTQLRDGGSGSNNGNSNNNTNRSNNGGFVDDGAGSWLSTQRLISDCLFHILTFLGPTHLSRVARTSRDLQVLADLDSLWMPLTNRDFGKDFGSFPSRFVRQPSCGGSGAGGGGGENHNNNNALASSINWKLVYKKFGESEISLEFRSGPRSGENLVVTAQGATVGRSRTNSVCILHDEMVSRRHARIVWRDRRYWIHDVGGINGTMVNSASLPQHVDCLLHFGDEVDLGASSFAIRIHTSSDDEERRLTARQQSA